MSQKKQILVVDDHFEMLEFLRSMLTIANPEHDVLAVPSAEEGFLELRRTPFDLVITDVRLPGISGFELVKRIKQLRPDTPIIMITAYSSAQGKEEAEQLGVFRYFRKPLDTDSLLAAVKSALGEGTPAQAPGPKPAAAPAAVADGPKADGAVLVRLRTLRTDTGAAQVALVQNDGRIVIHLADVPDEEEEQLAQIAAAAMRNSLELATQLRNDDPVMFQYQAGKRFDLYAANVGAHFFLLLLFRVRERRGRIGTIWVFTQRAVADLKEMLVEPPAAAPVASTGATAVQEQADEPAGTAEPAQEEVAQGAAQDAVADDAAAEEQRGGPETPVTQSDEIGDAALAEIEASNRELAELLRSADDAGTDEVDLEAYWEAALDEDESVVWDGLSYEEAVARGLVPPRLKNDES